MTSSDVCSQFRYPLSALHTVQLYIYFMPLLRVLAPLSLLWAVVEYK